MADPTDEFFDWLSRRGYEPLVAKVNATYRFDITRGRRIDHWLVEIRKGRIRVSRRNDKADCVIRADREVFDQIVSGRANAMAAMLRGVLALDGDAELLVHLQRLLPASVDGRKAQPVAGPQAVGTGQRRLA
jgi:putative sterol carrier protein